MKKNLVLMLTLIMVFTLSLTAGAAYYEEVDTYYDSVIRDANITPTTNRVEYEIGLSDSSPNHIFEGIYYLNDQSYVSFNKLFNEGNESLTDNLGLEFAYEFYNKNDWVLTGLAERRSDGKFITRLRTAKKVNDKLTLNNNFSVLFDDDMFKNLRMGLTYKLNEKNDMKLSIGRREGSYVTDWGKLFEALYFKGALKTKVNNNFNNVINVEKQFDSDNMTIIEEIEYTGMERVYLNAYFGIRTEFDNYLGLESKTKLRDGFYLTFDYYKQLGDSDYYSAYPGIQYEF